MYMYSSGWRIDVFNIFLKSFSFFQISQFLLDDAIARGCGSKCHVICTQPRRISAISGANFIIEYINHTH